MKQGKGWQSFAKTTHWSQQTPSSHNTRDDSTHGHHQMVNTKIRWLYITEDQDTVAKIRPGADCGSDHKLLISKFRLTLKKVGKIIKPFRYDLSQIPFDYTVEITNRFKGLDLVDRVPQELRMEVHDIVAEVLTKTISKKKKCKKAIWLSE